MATAPMPFSLDLPTPGAGVSTTTSNNTVGDEGEEESYNYSWIAAQLITIILLVSTIGILVSFVAYGKRNKKWTVRSFQMGKSTLLVLAVLACFSLLVSLVTTQTIMIFTVVHTKVDTLNWACPYIEAFKHSSTICTFLFTNFFLWWRLNALYRQPSMKHMMNLPFKVTSFVAIILCLIATCSFGFLLFTSTWTGDEMKTCRSIKAVPQEVLTVVAHFFLGIRVACSMLMFALLSYPLMIDRKKNRDALRQDSCAVIKTTGKLIRRKIRLATISVAICVVSDVTIQMVNKFALPSDSLRVLTSSMWDLNDYINVRSLIFCYLNYQEIILETCGFRSPKVDNMEHENSNRASV